MTETPWKDLLDPNGPYATTERVTEPRVVTIEEFSQIVKDLDEEEARQEAEMDRILNEPGYAESLMNNKRCK